jgi:hypothetical protein
MMKKILKVGHKIAVRVETIRRGRKEVYGTSWSLREERIGLWYGRGKLA